MDTKYAWLSASYEINTAGGHLSSCLLKEQDYMGWTLRTLGVYQETYWRWRNLLPDLGIFSPSGLSG